MTTTDNQPSPSPYASLEAIRLKKAVLLKDIRKDASTIDHQWRSLFHKPQALSKATPPGKRFSGLLSAGATMLDGAILAWKLYRKFKR